MAYFQKTKNITLFIRLAAFVAAVFIVLFWQSFSSGINSFTEKYFYKISGTSVPDSSIVIICITENDIEKLGVWPLKRSYYALAINNLRKAHAKKIGLEIFLSEGNVFQSIYNELLTQQIEDAGNVVLGSLVGGLKYENEKFNADSLINPSPKIQSEKSKTGHLNYLRSRIPAGSSEGIFIPELLIINDEIEQSFSNAIFDNRKELNQELVKVNFNISWNSFNKYSLLEFFQISENEEKLQNLFKDKIVLIGVSDPARAKILTTSFDEVMPGVGLHATALNNKINDEFIIYKYFQLSTFLFLLFGLALIYFSAKNGSGLYFTAGLFIIISFYLFVNHEIELNYSAFIIPVILILPAELINYLFMKKRQLTLSISETDILKAALKTKEANLEKMQKELVLKKNPPNELINQVSLLKNEIEQLKMNEQDEAENINYNEEDVKDFYGIIYRSKIIHDTVSIVKKTAPNNATILITGESGSGKELIANAVHQLSERRNNNFIAVNCAALSETLLESELFGHVKGAFTNAVANKKGLFEAADKGTIFLDEIGETNENFQLKLLRIIQSGEYQKVGSSETSYSDVRILAATNKNLEEMVKEKKFREDLFYRLNVINIYLPPLRERKEDIEPIVNFFLKRENKNLSISKAAMEQLIENEWKGNVRELESVVKRACIFASAENRDIIKLSDLPSEMIKNVKSNLEGLILESLREKEFSHTSINETAKELGNISRTIVSENFRGIVFKNYFDSNFEIDAAVRKISASVKPEMMDKVESKLNTYLKNIDKDLQRINSTDFEEIKKAFISKYKNLPQKYHFYLDEIIKNMLLK